MTTVLPVKAVRGLNQNNVFQVSGTTYIANSDPDLVHPFFTSSDLKNWTGVGIFPSMTGVSVAGFFNGKLFIWDGSWIAYSSNNGASWTETEQLGSSTQIAPLLALGGVLLGLRMSSGSPYILTSNDGITINQTETDIPPNGAYWNLVTFKGVMYALPDDFFSVKNRPIYTSSNGVNWTAVSGNWGIGVYAYGWFEINDRFYIIGGVNSSYAYVKTVYSTADMISWKLESYASTFTARSKPVSVIASGAHHLIGGDNGGYLLDVWKLHGGASVPTTAL